MQRDQKPFTVMGHSFLRANHVDSILQDIMTTHWYSQWLPQNALTIRAEMRANLNQNWVGMNDPGVLSVFLPLEREISFSLDIDKAVAPEIVEKIITAFREAFNARMMAMLHGVSPEPVVADVTDEFMKLRRNYEARKRQPNLIEWESYPIKAVVKGKNH